MSFSLDSPPLGKLGVTSEVGIGSFYEGTANVPASNHTLSLGELTGTASLRVHRGGDMQVYAQSGKAGMQSINNTDIVLGRNGADYLQLDSTGVKVLKQLSSPYNIPSGYYFGVYTGTGSIVSVLDRMRLRPYMMQANATIDRLLSEVTTLAAGSFVRMVCYAARSSFEILPGVLLADTGQIDAGSNGVKGDTGGLFTSFPVRAGQIIFLGGIPQSGIPGMRGTSAGNGDLVVWSSAAAMVTGNNGGIFYNGISGAPPADLSSTAPDGIDNNVWRLLARAA